MHRGHRLYLEDILHSIDKIQNYVGGISYDDLINDELRMDAIVRNLEIIGEASKNISEEIKNNYPLVEWKKITSFRNILAHDYFGIDYEILWDIIKNKLPNLGKNIKTIIDKEE